MEVNKRDKIHLETEVVKCRDCGEMKKEIEGIKDQLNQLQEIKDQLNQLPEMKEQISSIKEDMKEVKAMMGEVLHKLNNAEHVTQVPLYVNQTKEDIILAGGCTGRASNTVEKFSWKKKAWGQLPPMKEFRQEASSFVYKNQIFVAGGYTGRCHTDTMDVLKIDEQPLKWTKFPAKLPFRCDDHKTVVYQNSLIHIGGYNATEGKYSDAISEVLLTPPYSKKRLYKMPQRQCHGLEIFNDDIFILGGKSSSSSNSSLDSVLLYDVKKNELKQMPPLPRAVWGMATVRFEDKVVVIGGCDKDDKVLSDVLVYDSKTGESNVLSSMLHKRRGCSAIITGNVIVVMGGRDEKGEDLSSVECFTLGGNSWEELPPMIQPRYFATAVVMPCML